MLKPSIYRILWLVGLVPTEVVRESIQVIMLHHTVCPFNLSLTAQQIVLLCHTLQTNLMLQVVFHSLILSCSPACCTILQEPQWMSSLPLCGFLWLRSEMLPDLSINALSMLVYIATSRQDSHLLLSYFKKVFYAIRHQYLYRIS